MPTHCQCCLKTYDYQTRPSIDLRWCEDCAPKLERARQMVMDDTEREKLRKTKSVAK